MHGLSRETETSVWSSVIRLFNLAPALYLEFACNDKTVQIKWLEVVVTKSRLGRIQFNELSIQFNFMSVCTCSTVHCSQARSRLRVQKPFDSSLSGEKILLVIDR